MGWMHFCILEVYLSHTPTPPQVRSCIVPPAGSCTQACIYLIGAAGPEFHAQPCRSFSPSVEAVKLFIITRLSGGGRGTRLGGDGVESGGDFG